MFVLRRWLLLFLGGCLIGLSACQTAVPPPEMAPTVGLQAQPWENGRYTIDSPASRVSYTVAERFEIELYQESGDTFGNATAVGETSQLSGFLILDLNGQAPQISGELQVDLTTLVSGDERRDAQIQERWLEAARYPLAVFRPTAVANLPAEWRTQQPLTFDLIGELTIRDVTRPVTFQTSASLQDNLLNGRATTQILMTDFGFDPPHLLGIVRAANEVDLTIELQASREP